MQRELGGADQAAGGRVEAVVQADEVGLGEERREARDQLDAERRGGGGVGVGREGAEPHAPGGGEAGELAAAGAEADDAEGLAGQVGAHGLRLQVPAAGADQRLLLGQPLGEGEQQEEGGGRRWRG